jgi:hypothetical protein
MPYSDSRYANGYFYRVNDPRTGISQISVDRTFPSASVKYGFYVWADNDRVDLVAYDQLGSENLWWQIMDINPEIIDPFNIAPGTTIRIPHA